MANIALFSHHLNARVFLALATELNGRPGYFAQHFDCTRTPSCDELRAMIQGGVNAFQFAVFALQGPVAELIPIAQMVHDVTVPCGIVMDHEGYQALQRIGFADREKVRWVLRLTPGVWPNGSDQIGAMLDTTRMLELDQPLFTAGMATLAAAQIFAASRWRPQEGVAA